jgi:hypothetical protein
MTALDLEARVRALEQAVCRLTPPTEVKRGPVAWAVVEHSGAVVRVERHFAAAAWWRDQYGELANVVGLYR